MRSITDIQGLDLTEEVFEVLHSRAGATVERIVSNGQMTDWMDQDHDEWVLVLRGSARLEYLGGRQVALTTGQWLVIESGVAHRVLWTDEPTVWLAVHFPPAPHAGSGSGSDAGDTSASAVANPAVMQAPR